MTARVWRSVDEMARHGHFENDGYDDDSDDLPGQLNAGERIGGPPLNRRARTAKRSGAALALALGGGWIALNYPETVSAWMPDLSALKAAATKLAQAPPVEPRPAEPPASAGPPVIQPLAQVEVAATPGADPKAEAVAPSSPTAAEEQAEAALPAAGLDAFAKRATAAGLHPDLSRVLLSKLSPADYRNAAIAIKTALAETPDSGVYVYPSDRKDGLALFQVKFVPGAGSGCRRYVVEITKDRWLTTALPVEKCGTSLKASAH